MVRRHYLKSLLGRSGTINRESCIFKIELQDLPYVRLIVNDKNFFFLHINILDFVGAKPHFIAEKYPKAVK